jgi:hypothetical protein
MHTVTAAVATFLLALTAVFARRRGEAGGSFARAEHAAGAERPGEDGPRRRLERWRDVRKTARRFGTLQNWSL